MEEEKENEEKEEKEEEEEKEEKEEKENEEKKRKRRDAASEGTMSKKSGQQKAGEKCTHDSSSLQLA